MPSSTDKEKRQKRRQQKKKHRRNHAPLSPPSPPSLLLKAQHRRLARPYFSFRKIKSGKKIWCFLIGLTPLMAGASTIIPTGFDNNRFYYQMGGGSDYFLPAATQASPINLSVQASLGLGNQCGMYNPAISITNTMNDLADSVNNLTESVIANATGSLAEMPMYFLSLANPTLYNLLNNSLISAHTLIDASVKSCQQTRDEIAQGKNPYQDWATLSVGGSWKQHLSLTATGSEDINDANTTITENAGNDGVVWVQGKPFKDGSLHAAGKNQPLIHVMTDTAQAGYNTLLNRALNNDQPAPVGSDLAAQFPTPNDAVTWITGVLGDQAITTCVDAACKAGQGTTAGRGLVAWMTLCMAQNHEDCVGTLQQRLQNLVSGTTPANKDNLLAVSADNLVISPAVIQTVQAMEVSQQGIMIHKMAQEIAMQRILQKALMARDILQAGRQAPQIAINQPAQVIITDKLTMLDNELRSLSFTAEVRKQMMSDTLLKLMDYTHAQQNQAMQVGTVHNAFPLMEGGAVLSSLSSKGH